MPLHSCPARVRYLDKLLYAYELVLSCRFEGSTTLLLLDNVIDRPIDLPIVGAESPNWYLSERSALRFVVLVLLEREWMDRGGRAFLCTLDHLGGLKNEARAIYLDGIVYLGRLKICQKCIMKSLKSLTARCIV